MLKMLQWEYDSSDNALQVYQPMARYLLGMYWEDDDIRQLKKSGTGHNYLHGGFSGPCHFCPEV